jgi:hypothetical protein
MPGCNAHRRGTASTPLRHGGFTQAPDFCRKFNVRHEKSGDASQKAFQPKLIPPPIEAYCHWSKGPQFVHVEVFNNDGKLVSVSAIPIIV